MRTLTGVLGAAALAVPLAVAAPAVAAPRLPASEWRVSVTDADQSLRGLDAVDRETAWVSGGSVSGGSGGVFRTTDGGATWEDVSPPDAEGLGFRDVEARSATEAVVLSIGEGEASRIYRTTDGGATWSEAFRNAEPAAFYNCLDFYPGGRVGLAVSDPVDGRFRIARTTDGGRSWEPLPDDGMPDSTGEFNYSASGDCLTIRGNDAWFGSGGAAARVYHSRDRGLTWRASDAGVATGEAAGVFALAFRTPREGVVVGGDFAAPAPGTSSRTRDARTWSASSTLPALGEDAAWVSGASRTVLAVGEAGDVGGTAISRDGGRTWSSYSSQAFHTLDCTRDGSCWAAGSGGRVGVLAR